MTRTTWTPFWASPVIVNVARAERLSERSELQQDEDAYWRCFMRFFELESARAFALAFTLFASVVRADEPVVGGVKTPSVSDQIKGDWVHYQDTPNGRFMTIKEHLGDRTILTTYDPNQVAVYSHRSEYVVDESGEVPVFRYKNKVVLVGPNAGAKDPRESAYIFRVKADRFYVVHGMLPNDIQLPAVVVWERLKVNPIP